MPYSSTLIDNKITLSLAEYLELRDAEKFLTEIRAIALDSKCEYSADDRRDIHEIGYQVLARLNIPIKREEDDYAEV